MFGTRLVIQPTAGLTFRRLPSSILHIATYPFLPPTTMSGFLRRLAIGASGRLPDDRETPTQRATTPAYYVLARDLVAMGAYSDDGAAWVHTTKRQGIRSFKHDAFSRIYRTAEQKEVYQLHDWDYLMCERLTGYVLSEDPSRLRELADVLNRGCKLGKEGFAFVAEVGEVREFRLARTAASPSTVVPGDLLVGVPCDAFPLYRYDWGDGNDGDLASPTPSPVRGFVPFMAGFTDQPLEAEFCTDGEAFIPKALVDELRGDRGSGAEASPARDPQ